LGFAYVKTVAILQCATTAFINYTSSVIAGVISKGAFSIN
jgi:hypothetical protein